MSILPACWVRRGVYSFTFLFALGVLGYWMNGFRLPFWQSDLDRLREAGSLALSRQGVHNQVVSANLSGEQVTNSTLTSLESCQSLEKLNLSSTLIDDDGLQ